MLGEPGGHLGDQAGGGGGVHPVLAGGELADRRVQRCAERDDVEAGLGPEPEVGQFGAGEQLGGGAIGDRSATVDDDDPVC